MISLALSIFLKDFLLISISIFSELPYRYRFRYQYFPELPYRYRYRYFQNDHIDIEIFKKCRYIDNWFSKTIYRTGLLPPCALEWILMQHLDIKSASISGERLEKAQVKVWEAFEWKAGTATGIRQRTNRNNCHKIVASKKNASKTISYRNSCSFEICLQILVHANSQLTETREPRTWVHSNIWARIVAWTAFRLRDLCLVGCNAEMKLS